MATDKAGPGRGAGPLVHVELSLLKNNPYQPRAAMDEAMLEGLCESIARSGLLQPIVVRPTAGGGYQIVAGHRRVAAFRRLLERAESDDERQRYARIPAVERPELTDTQMAVSAFVENGQRQELTPLEEGDALARIRRLLPAHAGREASAREVAAAVGYDEKRVRRLLQLHRAPRVVKDGVMGQLAGPHAAGGKDLDRLHLMAALAFARLHQHRVRHGDADEFVRRAILRSLEEGWGLRRVQSYVDQRLRSGSGAPREPASVFRRGPRKLVVHTSRLPTASAGALLSLQTALRELLAQVDGLIARRAGPGRSASGR